MSNADMPASPVYNSEGYPSVGRTVLDNNEPQCSGLTKREELAARAMQGFCTAPNEGPEDVAKSAVKYADALLAELEK